MGGLIPVGRPRRGLGAGPAACGAKPLVRVGRALGLAAAGDSRGCTGEVLAPLPLVSVPVSGSWRDGRHSIRGRQLQTRAAGGRQARAGRPPPRSPLRSRPPAAAAGAGALGGQWDRVGLGRSQCPSEVAGPQPAPAPVSGPGGQNWAEALLSPVGAGAGDRPLLGPPWASGPCGAPLPGAWTWSRGELPGEGCWGQPGPLSPHRSVYWGVRAGPRGTHPEGHGGQGLALAGGGVGRVADGPGWGLCSRPESGTPGLPARCPALLRGAHHQIVSLPRLFEVLARQNVNETFSWVSA